MTLKETILRHKGFYGLLGYSLLFFLVKGISYAFIGSYFPILFIIFILLVFFISTRFEKKVSRRMIRVWAILLITWSIARIFIPIAFYFTPSITETHVREHFTILEGIITILMLYCGIYLWRRVKYILITK